MAGVGVVPLWFVVPLEQAAKLKLIKDKTMMHLVFIDLSELMND